VDHCTPVEALVEQLWLLIGLLLAPESTEGTGARACAGCHAEIVDRHRESRHSVAWTNPIFSAEYGESPKAWCVTCHAPEVAPADRVEPPAAAAAGVTCASCHRPRRPGAAIRSRVRRPNSIHATEIDPGFGRGDDCGRCHQFNFPVLGEAGRLLSYTDEPMQNTVVESRGADCIACHADHRFDGSHQIDMVRAAIDLELCRDKGSVELRLANRGAAHNVPSGGVNRFMTARLWRSSAPERLVELRLGRRFGPGGVAKRTVEDSTIAPGATARLRADLDRLGGEPDEPVNAELRYIYIKGVERTLADGRLSQAVIERRRVEPAGLSRCRPNAMGSLATFPRDRRRPGR
jgi:hypothetical protein